MDVKEMLSSSASTPVYRESACTPDLFDYDITDLFHSSSSSSNLPPILEDKDKTSSCTIDSITPRFLEPIPFCEDYRLENTMVAQTMQQRTCFSSKNLPSSSVPSSSSSCTSEPSSGFLSPLLSTCNSYSSISLDDSGDISTSDLLLFQQNNSTKFSSRYTNLSYIQPMRVIEEKKPLSSFKHFITANDHKRALADETKNNVINRSSPVKDVSLITTDTFVTKYHAKVIELDATKKPYNKNSTSCSQESSLNDSSSFTNYGKQRSSLTTADQLTFLTKNDHIKRPRNAWIHFRCHYGQALKSEDPTLRAEEISKRASHRWACLSDDQKKPWHKLAEKDKQAHREAFPGYKYCPRRANSAGSLAKQRALLNIKKRIEPNPSLYNKFNLVTKEVIDSSNKIPLSLKSNYKR